MEILKFSLMTSDLGENLKFGLMVAGIGLLVIFLLLGFFVLFIYGLGYLLKRKTGKNAGKTEKIDAKVVAAITASISCFYFSENISKPEYVQPDFIVKSIKRK